MNPFELRYDLLKTSKEFLTEQYNAQLKAWELADEAGKKLIKNAPKFPSMHEIIDNAITSTISRTMITHGSTETVVLAMLVFGGPALHGFAMALTIGIVFGIYSSVLVASPLALALGVKREHMIKVVKPKEEAVV